MDRILLIEAKIIGTFYLFLIIFNLITLYFIVDLLSYDEVIGYLTNGEEKSCNPRNLAFLFFVTTVSNLLFVSVALLVKLLSQNPAKIDEVR
ncbi:hypothetical protein [Flavobacterium sp. ZB4P13]|uniref:hypothetical protein n=1 Tax=Flavobacterium sp. ZB4P13 TaxID=3401728 RepID=UPI003AAD4354